MAVWIFGYGSLIWRPGFRYQRRETAAVGGWARKFWQGSPDHRGCPERPGRVVTLTPESGASCVGVAYQIAGSQFAATLTELDGREIGGYSQQPIALQFTNGEQVEALTYVAHRDNPHYLGPAAVETMVAQVLVCAGVSGRNSDYVIRLAEAVARIGKVEADTLKLAAAVRAALGAAGP